MSVTGIRDDVGMTHAFEKTKEEVADKVRKLLTLAEDPAATPEEAHASTMKAHELMMKYSIGLELVRDSAKPDLLIGRGWMIDGPYAGHKAHLISAVARANDCRSVYADMADGRKHIEVVGYPADVDWVETLWRSLEIQLAGALTAAARHKPDGVHGRTFAVGFIQGFIGEVMTRLHQARQAAMAAAEEAREEDRRRAARGAMDASVEVEPPVSSVALVLVAKAKRVEEEFKVRHPHCRTVYNNVRLQSWSGYGPGREAGRRAALARGSVGDGPRRLSA